MFSHQPVLLHEAVEALHIRENGIYVDGTAGGGGHSEAIVKRLTGGRLIALDQDPDAVKAAAERLAPYSQAQVIHSNFRKIGSILDSLGIERIDGLLLDLGVSSHQLDTPQRGFSYQADAPLDMRMSREGATAADLVNALTVEELSSLFFRYGEEKFSRKIAAAIVREREKAPVLTTVQLAQIVCGAVPFAARRDGHPARRVFQALRIAVNGELDVIPQAIEAAFERLTVGGVIAVITFHSLEDRIVKQQLAALCRGCECPPDFPVCVCGKTPRARTLTRKPLEASRQELERNPRSRSAKLRAIQKIEQKGDGSHALF